MTDRSMTKGVFLLILSLCLHVFPQPASAQVKSSTARIAQLLEESGHSYTKVADNVWTVAFEGEALSRFNVIVSTHETMLVLMVVVAEKKDLKVTPELMQKMLRFNTEMDRVKIGFDKDGDALVRVDLSVRVVDSEEFKANVEQVAAAADEVYAAMKPFITIAK